MYTKWITIILLPTILARVAQSTQQQIRNVKDLADLKVKRATEVLSDYLLLKSGNNCGRCVAIESLMDQLKKYITLPVYLMRVEGAKIPVLELHQLDQKSEDYDVVPYKGQMTTSGILKFLQDIISARSSSSPHPLKGREVADIDEAIEKSKATGGKVPFVFEVFEDGAIEFYEDIIRQAALENADFYLIRKEGDPSDKRIIVAHPDESRLSTSAEDKDQLVNWLKNESIAQFGELEGPSRELINAHGAWLVLIGGQDSYDLFQHEFRDFASAHRDHWRAGWVSKERKDWEQTVQKLLNIEEDIASFGRHIDEQGAASWSCTPDCIIGRDENVIKFMSTTNLSSDKLREFAESFAGKLDPPNGKIGEQNSQVPDFAVEFANRDLRVVRLSNKDFTDKIRKVSEPVLVLLRAADGEKSVELRSVIENVADILSPSTRIKFYEVIDLPPPDARYAAYDSIPHLWFKPIGVDEDPIAIPWQTTEPVDTVSPPNNTLISMGRKLASATFSSLRNYARNCLLKVKGVLEQLISSLNNQEL